MRRIETHPISDDQMLTRPLVENGAEVRDDCRNERRVAEVDAAHGVGSGNCCGV